MTLALCRYGKAVAVIALTLVASALAAPAAEELYGSIVGTVQDGSGAHIPGATVTIVNRDTNLTLTAVANETGTYSFSNVLPGTDDVKVALSGFKTFVKERAPVAGGAISRIDARLEVGQLSF
jgi:hypothetical protein